MDGRAHCMSFASPSSRARRLEKITMTADCQFQCGIEILDLILRCLLKPREAAWMLVRNTMQIRTFNNAQPGRLALKEYTVGMEMLGHRGPVTTCSQISRRYGVIVGKNKFERVQPKLKIFRQFPILPNHAQRLRGVQPCQSIRYTWIDPVIIVHRNQPCRLGRCITREPVADTPVKSTQRRNEPSWSDAMLFTAARTSQNGCPRVARSSA